MELMDGRCLDAVDAWQGSDLGRRGRAFLLVQTDGVAAADEGARVASVPGEFAPDVALTEDAEHGAPGGLVVLVINRRLE